MSSDSPGSIDRRVRVQGKPVDGVFPRRAPEAERGSVRRVTVVGEEVLHRPCRDVVDFGTPELAALIDDMFATMYVAEGVGLAANQIGVDLRVFVYDIPDGDGVRHVGHIINPVLDEIPAAQRRLEDGTEGCLSVPGPYLTVARPDHAIARGQDMHGEPLVLEGREFFARCLQHETDHLNGSLYIDRLSARDRKTALREMNERRDEVFAARAARAAALKS
ncbi:peptide deformylase [Actinoalloteichus hymeniacidonis]|uniref:Peptide deformylase n=1 Tax=Actinoalloteichus hymeniacidonis TaxID=340345 RepID=A0AAC9HPX7_9PSEU|nr:peptide deformylase [Actinoalloteichus hymeniacidonis]AOS63462.1 peptide deformylase [Actinoalloteichus hymeniacidonis]MBB5908496.1 peptide deformylase [Actinoalloteichus hymeniacidonis]